MAKEYDYLLKVLLVGDSDVGKSEILNNFDTEDVEGEKNKNKRRKKLIYQFIFLVLATYKTTIILLDGKKVKLQASTYCKTLARV